MGDGQKREGPRTPEQLVYSMIGSYISHKLKSKRGLAWQQVKDSEPERDKYNLEKEKIAKGAFLAVRSRTGADFIAYYTSTLCSVPQYLPEQDFVEFTALLHSDPERVRTLTMLALSAHA